MAEDDPFGAKINNVSSLTVIKPKAKTGEIRKVAASQYAQKIFILNASPDGISLTLGDQGYKIWYCSKS